MPTTRELTSLDKAFGLDAATLATARLRDPEFPTAKRAQRRAAEKRRRAARRRSRS